MIDKNEVRPLIRLAGGSYHRTVALKQLAAKLGVDRDTVSYWWRQRIIPRWWLDKVHAIAGENK